MDKKKVLFPDLDTPAILVDLDKLETNILRMADMAKRSGFKLRPHTKVHKSTYISELQIKAGAIGVSISKVNEAEVYVKAGIKDIMIVHPFYGDRKFEALKDIVPRAKISCVVDSVAGAEGISQVGIALKQKIPVLQKIDTGIRRFGTLPGDPTLKMVRELVQIPGIELVGILEHISAFAQPSADNVDRATFETLSVMSSTVKMLEKEKIHIEDVIVGATPSAVASCRYSQYFPEITEIHPGGYVFGDWMYINGFSMTEADCAATILVTVVSTPSPERACIDGGSKTFGADPLFFMAARSGGLGSWVPTYGSVKGRRDIKLARLTEEIGILFLSDPARQVNIGERLEIIPNHISLAVNMKDKMYGVRNGRIEREIPIICRGIDY